MAKIVKTDEPIVIIIDDTPLRRKAMVTAFEGLADIQLVYHDPENRQVRQRSAKGATLKSVGPALVTLRHFRDQDIVPDVETSLTIFYGGNGGSDRDRPEGEPEVIWRPVNAGSGTLSKDEAIELLAYANAKKKRLAGKKPAFLNHAYNPVLLPTLSILCQGYLAVHAEKMAGEWGPDEIKSALTHMKLPELFEESKGDMNSLIDSLPKKRDLVSSPDWWKSVMPSTKEKAEKQIKEELEVKAIGDCRALKNLVEEIYEKKEISPSVVAKAYCAVAEKLTGKPCKHG